MTPNTITITLSRKEGLVLFEWLSGLDSKKVKLFEHLSEEKVLWKVEGQLELVLAEPFAPNYRELLADARNAVEAEPINPPSPH